MGGTAWRRGFLAVLSGLSVAACAATAAPASPGPGRAPRGTAGKVLDYQRQPLAAAAGRSSRWLPVWRDSFTGPAGRGVNQRFWQYDTGQGVFGNDEIEQMTASARNVHLDGHGNLDITALGHGQSWSSGRIQTKSSAFAAPPGGMLLVTASIKQPGPRHGRGYWPAFWMLGPGPWPVSGEIDILEDVNALSQHSGTLHCGSLSRANQDGTGGRCHEHAGLSSGLLPCPGCQAGYHTYSVIIDRTDRADEQIRWYLDGRQFYAVSEGRIGHRTWARAVDHGFSVIFDLAMGGEYPQGACGCAAPNGRTSSGGTLRIRYVAVYDRPAARAGESHRRAR